MRDHFRPPITAWPFSWSVPLPHACPRCGETTQGTRSPNGTLWAECAACWLKIGEAELAKMRAMLKVMESVGPTLGNAD